MARKRVMSGPTVAVLAALADGVSYGFDIMDATGLASGTVYPILARLEARGLAESSWEDPRAHRAEGRPARRYYRITAKGRSALATELERFRALGLLLPRLA
ncbi:MAG: PadR family transcriptional regulator [Longimicrobiales bacterium]